MIFQPGDIVSTERGAPMTVIAVHDQFAWCESDPGDGGGVLTYREGLLRIVSPSPTVQKFTVDIVIPGAFRAGDHGFWRPWTTGHIIDALQSSPFHDNGTVYRVSDVT